MRRLKDAEWASLKSRHLRHTESGQALVLMLILAAMAGGAFWYIKQSRDKKEKAAWAYASEVSQRVILRGDTASSTPRFRLRQKSFIRPHGERLLEFIRAKGDPLSQVRVTGDIQFQNYSSNRREAFAVKSIMPMGPLTST